MFQKPQQPPFPPKPAQMPGMPKGPQPSGQQLTADDLLARDLNLLSKPANLFRFRIDKENVVLDFGGSDIESIAYVFRGFGAEKETYTEIRLLPLFT